MGGWIWKSEVRQFPCQTGPRGKHSRAIYLDTPRDRAFSQCDVQLVPSPLCPCLSPGVRLGRSKGSLDPGSRSFLPKEDFTLGSLLGPPTLGSWCTHAALAWGVRPPPHMPLCMGSVSRPVPDPSDHYCCVVLLRFQWFSWPTGSPRSVAFFSKINAISEAKRGRSKWRNKHF